MRRNFSYSVHLELIADFHQTAGSEPAPAGAGNGLGHRLPDLLRDEECCHRLCGLFALLLLHRDNRENTGDGKET